ncbi:MAG: hypothetical protein J5673_03125 [Candidatus Methanomethylophilaceae archaeon]|nr:hypothetical protein [Candidatus Methanomethylophilaceae archaeon]
MANKKPKKEVDNQSIDEIFGKQPESKLEIDPNTGLVEQVFEDPIDLEKQLFEKNHQRAQALKDLWYEDLKKHLETMKESEDVKKEMSFMMIANNVFDLIMGCIPDDMALELSYALDNTIALSLVNKKYDCDLIEEERKAISIVKREDYDTDDDYARALEAIEDHWWSIGQPQLDMRSASDAIIEMLRKYGLND